MREAREMCSRDGDYDGEHELHRLIEEKQAKLAAAVTNESAVVDDDGASEAQSDTEESESDDGRTRKNDGAADKILRQLRGAKEPQELERQPEVVRKTIVVREKHNYYKDTRVTSVPQEEQSAMPAGVVNVHEDSSDEDGFVGEQLEIEKERQELRAARQWVNQEGWDAEGEGHALDDSGSDVNLRLDWDEVRRQLARDTVDEADTTVRVDRQVVERDWSLEALDPVQRVFADRVIAWGRELVAVYKANQCSKRKRKRPPLLRTYLGGSAGSGKSTTLKTLLQHLRLLFQTEGVDATVELTAYTGVAAFNIGFGAKTACTAFRIYPGSFTKELKGNKCKELEHQWATVCLLIVDEISFIGKAFFYRMHLRLQQAKRGNYAQSGTDPEMYSFGDVSMILVGDFGQLEPIEDVSFCNDEITYRTCPKNLYHLWQHIKGGDDILRDVEKVRSGNAQRGVFNEAIMLKKIHRSKDDLWWTESCLRLRDFTMTFEEDYRTWLQHDLDRGHLSAEQKRYFDTEAVWLCARCEDVGKRNGRKLAHKAQDEKSLVHEIHAVHSHHKSAKRQSSSAFDGLRHIINLVRGCKVMLTRNIAYKHGLANGTRGKLVGVVYAQGAPVGTFPEALVVDIPDYCGPQFYKNQPTWVPILPMLSFKEGTRQTREQFPVVAGYALTINKSQGLTIKEGVVINLAGSQRFKPASKHGLPFVAFTRAESFAMTAFKNLPAWLEFAKGRECDMLRMRERFTNMLEKKHEETMRKFSDMKSNADEEDAFDRWKDQQAQRHKKQKTKSGPLMPCAACAACGW